MSEEEVPYIPPSKEQLEWIAEHKQPEEVVDLSRDVPEDPEAFIKQQKEFAEMTGAVVTEGEQDYTHDCTCLGCRKGWIPAERQGPGHFGTRFGDWNDGMLTVFKGEYDQEGAVKLDDVVEVNCDAGWALRVRMPIHTCRKCYQGACCYIDREGPFSVMGFTFEDKAS